MLSSVYVREDTLFALIISVHRTILFSFLEDRIVEHHLFITAFVIILLSKVSVYLLSFKEIKTGIQCILKQPLIVCALIAMPVIVILGTSPTHPPFSAGGGFGKGFVIGAIGALVALLPLLAGGEQRRVAQAGPIVSAVLCAAIPEIWMRHILLDAQMGIAIGWVTEITIAAVYLLRTGPAGRATLLYLMSGLGMVVTSTALLSVSEFREQVRFASDVMPLHWSAITILLLSSMPLLLMLTLIPMSWTSSLPGSNQVRDIVSRFLPDERSRKILDGMLRGAFMSFILIIIAIMLAQKTSDHPPFAILVLVGACAGISVSWLVSTRASLPGREIPTRWQNGALAFLVILSAGMVAYQLMAGIGVGITMTAVWLASLPTIHVLTTGTESDESGTGFEILSVLAAGSLLGLYRLFDVRFHADLQGTHITAHYALFGFLVGLLTPILQSGYMLRSRAESETISLFRLAILGLTTLLTPFLLLLIFGPKCADGIFMGLVVNPVICSMFMLSSADDKASSALRVWPVLLAMGIALAMSQWTHFVLPLALWSRAEKAHVVIIILLCIGVFSLLTDIADRVSSKRSFIRSNGQTTGVQP